MGDMAKRYEEMAAGLKAKAAELENTADTKRTWGAITGWRLTLGISTAILFSSAQGDVQQAQSKLAEALAKTENAKIAENAVILTNNVLIPAVKEFIAGMEACTSFLVNTKENLEKMKNYGEKGTQERYYKVMKKKAQVLSNNSMKFLMMTDMMRTDLGAIPSEPNDQNYVDIWFDKQKEQFKKENESIWDRIANASFGKKGEINSISNFTFCCRYHFREVLRELRSTQLGEYQCDLDYENLGLIYCFTCSMCVASVNSLGVSRNIHNEC